MRRFLDVFTTSNGRLNVVGWVLGIGLTWAFFQHLANGIRHLFMDIGANFELKGQPHVVDRDDRRLGAGDRGASGAYIVMGR